VTVAGDKTDFSTMNPTETALVIGGGVAGMQAALDIADQNYQVVLVEKTPSIGGVMAMLDKTFPTLDCSACILTPRLSEVSRHPNIKLLTYSEVTEITGEAGDFRVKVFKKAKMVLEDKCSGCGDCVPHCPIQVKNEFDQDLGYRKAIYIGFPQSTPLVYTIDTDNCIKCELCVKSCERDAIDLTMEDEEIEIPVGAIIIATGYELFDVSKYRRLGYGRFKLINASGPTGGNLMRLSDGKIPESIGFVQCVGARDVKEGVPYCSRICCMYGVKNAVMAKELQHENVKDVTVYAVMAKELQHENVKDVTVYYADIRAYGKGFEEFYQMSKSRFGIKFIRGRVAEINEDSKTGDVIVSAENTETSEFLKQVGLNVGSDGFISIEHPASNPVDTNIPGVYVAGCAEAPKDIPDSVAAGSAAAMRASITLSRGGAS